MSSSVDQDFFWEKIVKAKRRLHKNKSVQSQSNSFDLFQTIKLETLHKIWSIYKEDFDVWERLLVEGTPRQEGESTLYDFYTSSIRSPLPFSLPLPFSPLLPSTLPLSPLCKCGNEN